MEKRFGPVLFVPGDNSGNYPCCHSLYVQGDVKVVIDPASNRERLRHILDTSGVDAVFLSHWHEDHFMHLDLFDGKELWISRFDAVPLRSLEDFFDAYGMTTDERPPWTQTMYELFHFTPRAADRFIESDEVIDLGGVTVEVIHTPGHTPGHSSLYFREQEILFLGDYDLTAFGPWYGDVSSDIDATIDSVNRLRRINARVWIASHGKGVFESEPGDLWDPYVRVIDERDENLMEFLKEPRTMAEIVERRIVYRKRREPKEFYDFGERAIMSKHLERMIKKGLVVFDGRLYRRN
ncbi:MAG: MBL fold metallo-hydrolase [Deltaproteobacteria bacterium]|nr:MBL fold metallo-hydrolase [Deltaproteobacteria bacterium]